MDLTIVPQKGDTFEVEVGFFDTILEIKQKIQKYRQIPVSDQTLVFKRQTLADERDVRHYDILHNSRLTLLPAGAVIYGGGGLHVSVRIPGPRPRMVTVDAGPDETVAALKERVRTEVVAVVGLRWMGAELAEERTLREVGIGGGDVAVEMEAILRRAAGTVRVTVVGKCGTKKVAMDVRVSDSVAELRTELHRLNKLGLFQLPAEGFFFIHKQSVMDDDQSFRWHRVAHGDVIEVFNGTVTGGS